jgi:aminopeptidase N
MMDGVIDSLKSWMRDEAIFILGDAKGSDAKFQQYLKAEKYPNVEAYYSGKDARHKLGKWKTCNIDSELKKWEPRNAHGKRQKNHRDCRSRVDDLG